MLAGLIHAERPDELRRGLRWLYGFVRPQRRRIAGLLLLLLQDSGPVAWVLGLWFAENLLLFTGQVLIPLGFNDGSTILYWMRRERQTRQS